MRIGLDFDGVITNCGELKVAAAKTLYNKDIPASKFKSEILYREGLLSEQEYKALQRFIYDGEFGHSMEPVEGMLEHLPKLAAEHDVRIITCRSGRSAEIAEEWLRRTVPHLSIELIGVGKTSKAPACAGIDMFVDDDLDKLEQLVGTVPHRYLMSWEYNTDAHIDGVASRLHSWTQLYGRAQELERKAALETGGQYRLRSVAD